MTFEEAEPLYCIYRESKPWAACTPHIYFIVLFVLRLLSVACTVFNKLNLQCKQLKGRKYHIKIWIAGFCGKTEDLELLRPAFLDGNWQKLGSICTLEGGCTFQLHCQACVDWHTACLVPWHLTENFQHTLPFKWATLDENAQKKIRT